MDLVLAERGGTAPGGGRREACRRRRRRQQYFARPDLWVSVNLSGVQLQHPALVDEVTEALRASSLKLSEPGA